MGWLRDKGLVAATAAVLGMLVPPQLRPVVEVLTGIEISRKVQQAPIPPTVLVTLPAPTPAPQVQVLDETVDYSARESEPSYITALHDEISSLRGHITEECK